MMAFQQEPALHVVEVSHIEEFGRRRAAPEGAIVHFQGDDLQDGPMIRYSIVRRLAYSARGFGGELIRRGVTEGWPNGIGEGSLTFAVPHHLIRIASPSPRLIPSTPRIASRRDHAEA